MKLLITGGCGFLGSNLAHHALSQGIDLCVFDNLSRKGASSNKNWLTQFGDFKFVHGDIRNAHDVERVVESFMPTHVFHLVGQVAMTTSIDNPRLDFEINAVGTFNLLDAVRRKCPNASILYSSTNKVYGDLEQYAYRETDKRYICDEAPNGFDETTPLDFRSPYGTSKGCADQYILDFGRTFGLKTAVFRHSSMYGGRQFATTDQGWIGWFCEQAVKSKFAGKEAFTISGNGKQVRDVLHAKDMISLYFTSAEKIENVAGHAFNIGGGMQNSLSLLELFDMLERLEGTTLSYTKLPPRASDQRIFVADTAKAEALIGWTPKVSVADGIPQMLDWVKSI